MTFTELLNEHRLVESLIDEVVFSPNCVTLEIHIRPGVFIAPDVSDPQTLVLSFQKCMSFEMVRSNVSEFERDQLFLTHEGSRTITAFTENRALIPSTWENKYGSAITSIVIETVDLVLKVICFDISVR